MSLEFFAELKQKTRNSWNLEDTYFMDACEFRGNLIIGGVVRNRDLVYTRYLDGIVASLSSNFEIVWSWKYGGTMRDVIEKISCDKEGNIFTVGHTESWNAIKTDMWVMKLNPRGHIVWSKHIGGRWRDEAHDLALCPNGDIVVAGITYSFGHNTLWVLRLSSDGEMLWQRTYDVNSRYHTVPSRRVSLAILNGNIYVVRSVSTPNNGVGLWLLKLNRSGDVESSHLFNLRGFSRGKTWSSFILPVSGDSLLIGGETDSISSVSKSFVLNVSEDAELLWAKGIGSAYPFDDVLNGGVESKDSIILYGETSSFGNDASSGWLLNIDLDGNLTSELVIDVGYSDAVNSALFRNGNLIAIGSTFSVSTPTLSPKTFSLTSVNWGMVAEILPNDLKKSSKKSYDIPLEFSKSELSVYSETPPLVPVSPHYLDKIVRVNELDDSIRQELTLISFSEVMKRINK